VVTILNASTHKNGINDIICQNLCDSLIANDKSYQYIKLRDLKINLCSNCRLCMTEPGNDIGKCWHSDDMNDLVKSILLSNKLILSAPVNCYDLPSIMRIMLERMGVFCYWTDDMYAPKVRPRKKKIKGILITTSALPGIMVPLLTGVRKTFKLFAKPIGINNIDYFHIGFKGKKQHLNINDKDRRIVGKIINLL